MAVGLRAWVEARATSERVGWGKPSGRSRAAPRTGHPVKKRTWKKHVGAAADHCLATEASRGWGLETNAGLQ